MGSEKWEARNWHGKRLPAPACGRQGRQGHSHGPIILEVGMEGVDNHASTSVSRASD